MSHLLKLCVLGVFGFVFFLAGIGVLGIGVQEKLRSTQSKSWPATEGYVEESFVDEDWDSDGTMYKAMVKYTYVVDGKEYRSSQVSFGSYSSSNKSPHHKIVNRYPEGESVLVYYNPRDIHEAVLEPGFSSSILLPIGIGLVFSLVGAGIMMAAAFLFITGRRI